MCCVHCVLGNVGGIPPERYSWVPYPFSRSWGVPPTIAVRRSPPDVHFLVPLFFFVHLFVALIINIFNFPASSLHHKPAFTLFSCPTSVVRFQLYYSLVSRSFWLPHRRRLHEVYFVHASTRFDIKRILLLLFYSFFTCAVQ